MSIKKWTPIQEGRFHLRSRKPGERFDAYVRRVTAVVGDTPGTRARVKRTLALARAERRRAAAR
jgi:hypothetical protein